MVDGPGDPSYERATKQLRKNYEEPLMAQLYATSNP